MPKNYQTLGAYIGALQGVANVFEERGKEVKKRQDKVEELYYQLIQDTKLELKNPNFEYKRGMTFADIRNAFKENDKNKAFAMGRQLEDGEILILKQQHSKDHPELITMPKESFNEGLRDLLKDESKRKLTEWKTKYMGEIRQAELDLREKLSDNNAIDQYIKLYFSDSDTFEDLISKNSAVFSMIEGRLKELDYDIQQKDGHFLFFKFPKPVVIPATNQPTRNKLPGTKPGTIQVIDKASGMQGEIPEGEFDPSQFDYATEDKASKLMPPSGMENPALPQIQQSLQQPAMQQPTTPKQTSILPKVKRPIDKIKTLAYLRQGLIGSAQNRGV